MFKKCAVLSLAIGFAAQAGAFQLSDHKQVTLQAYAEFVECFPQYKDQLNASWLLQGDYEEDLNLVEKELFYSHYYNPTKKLDMWRGSSSDRIADLAPDLLTCRSSVEPLSFSDTILIGHAVHHFQDMAVPAHVVPITHSFWDGFESYSFNGDISSQWTCADIAAASDVELQDILDQTALQTLAAINSYSVVAVDPQSHTTRIVNGKDFWAQSADNSFGSYGSLGNQFGNTEVAADADYARFKQQQMKLAVKATLRGLAWVLQPPP